MTETSISSKIDRENKNTMRDLSESMKEKIAVVSISPIPMMSSGGKIGVGMTSIYQFHKPLIENGYEVYYIQAGDYESDYFYDIEGVSTRVIKIRQLFRGTRIGTLFTKCTRVLRFLFAVIPAVTKLILELQKRQKNIVLVGHLAEGAIAASVLAKRHSIPNISRLYGTLLSFHQGFDLSYPVGFLRKKLNKIRYYEELLALKCKADAFALTNDGTHLDKIVRHYHGDKVVSYHLINGVEINEPNTDEINAIREKYFKTELPVVLSAGRLTSWKRPDRILKIAAICKQRKIPARFFIFGGGDLKHALIAKTKSLGLEGYLQIMDPIPQEEMTSVIAACNIFLSTQDFSNLTNSILEAICLYKPVITIDVGGIREVITNQENGILVPLIECELGCAEAIINILNSDPLRVSLATGAAFWKKKEKKLWRDRSNEDLKLVHKLASRSIN